jgi:GNAT superfamily N-acetyltransferase
MRYIAVYRVNATFTELLGCQLPLCGATGIVPAIMARYTFCDVNIVESIGFHIRLAAFADVPVLRSLIHMSVRGLQAQDYTPAQIEGALATVYGVDTQLIADGTYFVVEATSEIVACGGWSKRKTLYGADHCAGREDSLLDPTRDAAKIRAFFVHPAWTRRGIGSMILEACEAAVMAAGFRRLEMGATLTGVPLYQARGYLALENLMVPLPGGESLPIVRMEKRLRNG